MRVALVLFCAMLCLTATNVVVGPAHAQRPGDGAAPPRLRSAQTREALDRYLKGDYQGALTGAGGLARFDPGDADRWIAAGGPAGVERRRLASALFVLEYSGLRPALLPSLITWARDMLSRQPPRPNEALWLRASIALAQGLDRWVYLLEGVPQAVPRGAGVPSPGGHIRFARTRFPDDPHFQMAEGIGAEVAALRPLDRLSAPPAQSSTGWDRIEADLIAAGSQRLAERTAAFERAAGLFERLTSHTDLAAEAHLRLGYVRLCQGQRDMALGHFDRVAALTEDRRLRYLAHLYSGWILGGFGRLNEAVIAYRAALRFVPGAQSAATLLVALLTRNNQLDEAERMADEFLAGTEGADDPWRAYFIGDFAAYPRLVRQLREALP